ncbi:zincin-like metallopeptidase domain-containing protein [Brevundimonas sp. 2R-24]|uniref:Zincin-like metallopeptidase domain-containing protein n=1 Tax=Peiella sedimenti TaxID=3061083 RepID=A0ABT8SNF8_9CAUL|nr:zincin-like metallopeptidase domain-containing protein [Caulobacteraceae bacterium XZ-24]
MEEVHSKERFDVYRAVTDKIVEAIEAGAGAFVMPWHQSRLGRPANAVSKAQYQGVNVIALWAEAMVCGYASHWWATYDQWQRLGAQVGRGQHGATVVFYRSLEAESEDEEEEKRPRLVARAFRVFNADQVRGWVAPEPVCMGEAATIEAAEAFVASTKANVRLGGEVACFRPLEDLILMPERERFIGTETSTATEAFYATLFHELVHWSGAPGRLNREFGQRFGDQTYAAEELIAELGAAFLCADYGVSNKPRRDHAAYLTHWLELLRADKRAIFTAAQKARQAITYLNSLVLSD